MADSPRFYHVIFTSYQVSVRVFLMQLAHTIPIHARNGGFNVLLTSFIPITDEFLALSKITRGFSKWGTPAHGDIFKGARGFQMAG
jgi:hypothetical protein